MSNLKEKKAIPELISAKSLMLSIGVLAFIFPILLIIASMIVGDCESIQGSISAYYHTISRNLFVGTLCAISFCLFAYKGYSETDNLLATVAASLALGVAFFPTPVDISGTNCITESVSNGLIGNLHFISAALLFVLLGYFSAFLFTKSKGEMTKQKAIRNSIFKVCGYSIFAFILLIAAYILKLKELIPSLVEIRPIFWLETLALWAFSFSWLTKSGVIYKD